VTLSDPWVDPATIPELTVILRRRLLSKVRIFAAWCERGDRLAQVIRVNGRPLALDRQLGQHSLIVEGDPEASRTTVAHRLQVWAMWLDLDWSLYYLPYEPPGARGVAGAEAACAGSQCQLENAPIPAYWLRQQVEAGVRSVLSTPRHAGRWACVPEGNNPVRYAGHVDARLLVKLVDLRAAARTEEVRPNVPKSLPHQIAANTRWSREDPKAPDAAPALARAGLEAKFLDEVDPDRVLPEDERNRRADCARRAYYQRLALASVKARRGRKAARGAPTAPDAA